MTTSPNGNTRLHDVKAFTRAERVERVAVALSRVLVTRRATTESDKRTEGGSCYATFLPEAGTSAGKTCQPEPRDERSIDRFLMSRRHVRAVMG